MIQLVSSKWTRDYGYVDPVPAQPFLIKGSSQFHWDHANRTMKREIPYNYYLLP